MSTLARWPTIVLVGVVVIAGGLLLGALIGSVSAGEDTVEIADCTVIDEPGTYELVADLAGSGERSCLEIRETSGVVIEGNGHSLGHGADRGIEISGASEVVIRDVAIEGIADREGVAIDASEDVTLTELTITDASHGVAVRDGTNGVTVTDTTITDIEGSGVMVRETSDVRIEAVDVLRATDDAVRIAANSEGIHVEGVTAEEVFNGVYARASTDITVVDNHVDGAIYGVVIRDHSADAVIRNNVVRNSDLCGMAVKYDVESVVIEGNEIENHAGLGVHSNVSDVVVRENRVVDSTVEGIHTGYNANDVSIVNNHVVNSSRAGIHAWSGASGITVEDNSVVENDAAGIRVSEETADVQVIGNVALDNDDEGIVVSGSTGVQLQYNELEGNPAGIGITDASEITIERTDIRDTTDGVVLTNVSNVGVDDIAIASDDVGMTVTQGSTSVIVEESTISDAGTLLRVEHADPVVVRESDLDELHLSVVLQDATIERVAGDAHPADDPALAVRGASGDASVGMVTHDTADLYGYGGDWIEFETERIDALDEEGIRIDGSTLPVTVIALAEAPAAAITIHDVDLDSTAIVANETVTATVTLENTGVAAGEIEVPIEVDGEVVANRSLAADAGESTDVTIDMRLNEPGDYEITIGGVEAGTVTVEPPEQGGDDTSPVDGGNGDNVADVGADDDQGGTITASGSDDTSHDDSQPAFGVGGALLAIIGWGYVLRRGRAWR